MPSHVFVAHSRIGTQAFELDNQRLTINETRPLLSSTRGVDLRRLSPSSVRTSRRAFLRVAVPVACAVTLGLWTRGAALERTLPFWVVAGLIELTGVVVAVFLWYATRWIRPLTVVRFPGEPGTHAVDIVVDGPPSPGLEAFVAALANSIAASRGLASPYARETAASGVSANREPPPTLAESRPKRPAAELGRGAYAVLASSVVWMPATTVVLFYIGRQVLGDDSSAPNWARTACMCAVVAAGPIVHFTALTRVVRTSRPSRWLFAALLAVLFLVEIFVFAVATNLLQLGLG